MRWWQLGNFLVILIVLCSGLLRAQNKIEGMIINEVYLDADYPSKNWIEIYNPTNETLSLSQFSISTYLTANLLNNSTVGYYEITIEQNEYVLLCASDEVKSENDNKKGKAFVFKPLSTVDNAGIIMIGTKEKGIDGYDIIKYGKDLYSSKVAEVVNATLIPFSSNGKSYSRNIKGKTLGDKNYYESEPTPLEKNK